MHFIYGFGGYFEAHGEPEPLTYVAPFFPHQSRESLRSAPRVRDERWGVTPSRGLQA